MGRGERPPVTAALSVRSLSKTFAGQRALVDVELRRGAGRDPCVGGRERLRQVHPHQDPGRFPRAGPWWRGAGRGAPLALGHYGAADAAGLRFVHQDLGLVATLDTVDNLALGNGYQLGRDRRIHWGREARRAAKALTALGYDIDVRLPVGQLSISERTAVAVARSMSSARSAATLLVLDEPTANLPAAEAARLFSLVRTVRDSGVAVLFVSHHFDEVFGLADTVTVLRDGRVVDTRPVKGLAEHELVELMIGRSLELHSGDTEAAERAELVLSLRGSAWTSGPGRRDRRARRRSRRSRRHHRLRTRGAGGADLRRSAAVGHGERQRSRRYPPSVRTARSPQAWGWYRPKDTPTPPFSKPTSARTS